MIISLKLACQQKAPIAKLYKGRQKTHFWKRLKAHKFWLNKPMIQSRERHGESVQRFTSTNDGCKGTHLPCNSYGSSGSKLGHLEMGSAQEDRQHSWWTPKYILHQTVGSGWKIVIKNQWGNVSSITQNCLKSSSVEDSTRTNKCVSIQEKISTWNVGAYKG